MRRGRRTRRVDAGGGGAAARRGERGRREGRRRVWLLARRDGSVIIFAMGDMKRERDPFHLASRTPAVAARDPPADWPVKTHWSGFEAGLGESLTQQPNGPLLLQLVTPPPPPPLPPPPRRRPPPRESTPGPRDMLRSLQLAPAFYIDGVQQPMPPPPPSVTAAHSARPA
eukprot:3441669-Prymnesium_polylepis.1